MIEPAHLKQWIMRGARKARDGSTAIEYALIAGLLVLAIVTGVTALGEATRADFEAAANSYPSS
jgi:Flp pilus assembly pilin Flp